MINLIIQFIALISFFIAYSKKPSLPLRIIVISLIISLSGTFFLQYVRRTKHRLLPVDENFILLEDKEKPQDDSPWDSYIQIYGTDKTVQEVRDFFKESTSSKTMLERILNLIPGGETLTYKKFLQYGDENEESLLLEIQYATYNSAFVSINSPPLYRKDTIYPTEVYINYRLWKWKANLKYLLIQALLGITVGIIFYLTGRAALRNRKKRHTSKPQ